MSGIEQEVARQAHEANYTIAWHTCPDDVLQQICDRVAGQPATVDLARLRQLLKDSNG